jgi:hypothetical protein
MDNEHEKRLTQVEARAKSNSHRLDDVEAEVKEISGKPARMWEAIVTKVVLAIVAAVVGFFLAKIGL